MFFAQHNLGRGEGKQMECHNQIRNSYYTGNGNIDRKGKTQINTENAWDQKNTRRQRCRR